MATIDDLVRDLRGFERRKELLNQLRRDFRAGVPVVRKKIRTRALATLPKTGGLAKWVSKTRVSADIRFAGRWIGVRLKGSRKSLKEKSDLKRLDAGMVRHPSWGRRGKGDWHTQPVTAGFFTAEAGNADDWRDACERAVDRAFDTIRRG